MPLTWDLSQIKDHRDICWIGDEKGDEPDIHMNPVTETLIFMTIAVKLGAITEANADEFYARLKIIEKLDGPFLSRQGKPEYFTPEMVQTHIGLVCNVTNESTAKFFGSLRTGTFKDYKRQYKSAVTRQKDQVPA